MTKSSYHAMKGWYGIEIRYQPRIQCFIEWYVVLHRVGCDLDKETVKVPGLKWTLL